MEKYIYKTSKIYLSKWLISVVCHRQNEQSGNAHAKM